MTGHEIDWFFWGSKTVLCAVVLASNRRAFMEAARVILPVATFAEADGTFTNGDGRVQRFRRAFEPLGAAMADREAVLALGRRVLGATAEFESAAAVFDALARSNPAFRGLDYAALGDRGRPLAGAGGKRDRTETAG
jgi:predicted molibdopterin-dependent oxidoreductase YjgC